MHSKINPSKYYKILYEYKTAQIFLAALKLDIFSYLDRPIKVENLSKITNFNVKNLSLFLLGLSSCNLVEKHGEYFCNNNEGKKYLSKNSFYYIGETLLFREEMTSLNNIEKKLILDNNMGFKNDYDFAKLARLTIPEMYATERVSRYMSEIKDIFPNVNGNFKMLDLGGGSGILAVEFVKYFTSSKAYIFESADVAVVTKEVVKENNLEDKITVLTGDFNVDDIGNNYDLIVASGILDFASEDFDSFIMNVSKGLKKNGYLIIIGQLREKEGYVEDNILNWLSGYMNGLVPAKSKSYIENIMRYYNIIPVRCINVGNFKGYLYYKN